MDTGREGSIEAAHNNQTADDSDVVQAQLSAGEGSVPLVDPNERPFDEVSEGGSDRTELTINEAQVLEAQTREEDAMTYVESEYGATIDVLVANRDFVEWFGSLDIDDAEWQDMPEEDRQKLESALDALDDLLARQCSICGDDLNPAVDEVIRLICRCVRCHDCLNNNVRAGLESRLSFPPRCHVDIDIQDIAHHLDPDVIERWHEVRESYTDRHPTYCAIPTCSRYISHDEEQRWAVCSCGAETCRDCHSLAGEHEGDVCPPKLAPDNQKLVDDEKWQMCGGCSQMIERAEGCDHMTCQCGYEFCYTCGREYNGGMPCNCAGQREWVDGEDEQDHGDMDGMDDVGEAEGEGDEADNVRWATAAPGEAWNDAAPTDGWDVVIPDEIWDDATRANGGW